MIYFGEDGILEENALLVDRIDDCKRSYYFFILII